MNVHVRRGGGGIGQKSPCFFIKHRSSRKCVLFYMQYNFSLHFLCILLTLFIALKSEVKNSLTPRGRLKTGGDRIYNGRDANYEDHPWAAFLEVKKPDNDPGKVSICGGTIINGSRCKSQIQS